MRINMPVHDIAPMCLSRRGDLLNLAVADQRIGYPVEFLQKVTVARSTVTEHDVTYYPRATGTRSKVSGSVRRTARTARNFWRVLS